MRKIIFTIIICIFITAVLVAMSFISLPYINLIMSAVSTAMFIGFAFLIRTASPKIKARKFFALRGIRLVDFGMIFWSTVVLVSGTFLLNLLTSVFCEAVGISSGLGGLFSMNPENYLIVFITVAVIPAFTEEFFFRGAVLSTLDEKGYMFSILVSSVLFTAMHGLDIYFLPTFFAGVILAFVVKITKSVFASTAVHMINNILTYILWLYAKRLFAVELESIMIYAAIFALLIGLIFIVSSSIKRLKKEMFKQRTILNEGEIVWAKNQEKDV